MVQVFHFVLNLKFSACKATFALEILFIKITKHLKLSLKEIQEIMQKPGKKDKNLFEMKVENFQKTLVKIQRVKCFKKKAIL